MRLLLLLLLSIVGCGPEGTLRIDIGAIEDNTANVIEVYVLRAADQDVAATLCDDLASATIDVDDEGLTVERYVAFRLSDGAPELGRVTSGRRLFFARARSMDCTVVGSICEVHEVTDGRDLVVDLVLEPSTASVSCPPALVCDDGACRECRVDTECGDSNGCTSDRCDAGTCEHVVDDPSCVPCAVDSECDDDDPCTRDWCATDLCASTPYAAPEPDVDGDGHCPTRCGEGCDDCDDGNARVHGGAERRCGAALDHDCDGVIDDTQGCDPCTPSLYSPFERLSELPVDASRGLFVVGADPDDDERLRRLYAVSQTEVTVCTVHPDGAAPDCVSTGHGLTSPLPPLVVGEHLLLLGESQSMNRLAVFATDALDAGPIETIGRWGRALSAFVDHDMLYVADGPGTLWAVDIGRLPEVEEPQTPVLSTWAASTDMTRVGDHIVGISPLLGPGTLVVAVSRESELPVLFREYSLTNGIPRDVESFPELGANGFVGLAQTQEGLSLIPVDAFDEATWDRDFQDAFNHAEFPSYGCGPDTSQPCERAVRVSRFGPTGAIVLTREVEGTEPALALHFVDVSLAADGVPPTIGPSVRVQSVVDVDSWTNHLFVSGSMVFVATAAGADRSAVEIVSAPCAAE